ncbi:hypothetical protein [Dyella koreensis]|uniref:Uncharacterized protein n=1 Tax=Dyella koreensis TaxID=311235 RepID=A0ABW8K3F3_9GAMM
MAARVTVWTYCFLALVCFGIFPTSAHSEQPVRVTVCQLLADPGRYNHALVEVSGDVGHGFEDFTLTSGHCDESSLAMGVWLEYGGKQASGTMYCCGVQANRTRPEVLVVDGVTTQLRDDAVFRDFDQIIQRRPYAKANATLVGRFFSGEPQQLWKGKWAGYGHMGMFTLLVIEQVLSVTGQHSEN